MSGVKWLFVGPDGLRHGWRFLIFAAVIFLVVRFLEQPAIAFLAAKCHVDRSALSAPSIIVSDGFDLIVILIVTGVAARFEQRRIDSYGLPINEVSASVSRVRFGGRSAGMRRSISANFSSSEHPTAAGCRRAGCSMPRFPARLG
jgi:hypothetical protein